MKTSSAIKGLQCLGTCRACGDQEVGPTFLLERCSSYSLTLWTGTYLWENSMPFEFHGERAKCLWKHLKVVEFQSQKGTQRSQESQSLVLKSSPSKLAEPRTQVIRKFPSWWFWWLGESGKQGSDVTLSYDGGAAVVWNSKSLAEKQGYCPSLLNWKNTHNLKVESNILFSGNF